MLQELLITAPSVGSTIHALTHDRPADMLPLFNAQTPSLRDVTLGPIALNIDAHFLRNLRSIRLAGGRVPFSRLVEVLEANARTLEILTTIMVHFVGAEWPLPSLSSSEHNPANDRLHVTLPALTSLSMHAARPSMGSFLFYVKMPALSLLTLCRTEDEEEMDDILIQQDLQMIAVGGAIIPAAPTPAAANNDQQQDDRGIPNTAAVLDILCARITSPLRTFSLTYGSVWETNPLSGEKGTDRALISFLTSVGGSIESLSVHNYSHIPSTLLHVCYSLLHSPLLRFY